MMMNQRSVDQENASPPANKKRNLPGNPDPDAEVIALSPKTLMTTNRFMCEICNKGFQRDQNLQLHKRGHNLPWKLKQRSREEVLMRKKKKVYICPDLSCVHNHPSRALGDLTGIKKHFSRKHGEKKYKCDKCSKKYAVQSDWKAHSKKCGTREYKCDCGTIFSRRDSFITHRAFCDAMADESPKEVIPTNASPLLFPTTTSHDQTSPALISKSTLTLEQQLSIMRPEINSTSTWMPTSSYSGSLVETSAADQYCSHDQNHSRHLPLIPLANFQVPPPSAHLSATALLQKAAQMGATMNRPEQIISGQMGATMNRPDQIISGQMATDHSTNYSTTTNMNVSGFGLGFAQMAATNIAPTLLSEMMMMPPLSFNERDMVGNSSSKGEAFATRSNFNVSNEGGGGSDGLTRNFMGLRAFSHKDTLSILSFEQYHQNNNNNKPWFG